MNRQQHLVFFDADCRFCERAVQNLKRKDAHGILIFEPLDGKMAEKWITPYLKAQNSLVLIEDYRNKKQAWIRGKAVFRIFWLFGGKWKALGWLCFLPILPNLFYRFIASHRHLL